MVKTKTYNTVEPAFDFEIESEEKFTIDESAKKHSFFYYLRFLMVGVLFGIVLVKGEVISWFRIQEMFRFQSFHMYGVIGTAVIIGIIGVFIIKRMKLKSVDGTPIDFTPKKMEPYRVLLGGTVFGLGWAMTGACPGPIYALIGSGATVFVIVLISAIAGTYVYGKFKGRLPH